MDRYLITLSSPIAIRIVGGTKMVNTVEATIQQLNAQELCLHVSRYFDSKNENMWDVKPEAEVTVKMSNLRSKQSVGGSK